MATVRKTSRFRPWARIWQDDDGVWCLERETTMPEKHGLIITSTRTDELTGETLEAALREAMAITGLDEDKIERGD